MVTPVLVAKDLRTAFAMDARLLLATIDHGTVLLL